MAAGAIYGVLTLDTRQTEYVLAFFAFFINVWFSVAPLVAAELERSREFSLYFKICRVFLLPFIYLP